MITVDDESYRDHLVDEAMDILDEQKDQIDQEGPPEQERSADDDFTRWEERFILQYHDTKTVDEIASEIGRDVEKVRERMQQMGLLD